LILVRVVSPPRFSLVALLELAVVSNRRAVIALALVSLLAFLPGVFQIPPVDRDEARFAQAAKQMIETGDYIDIRFQRDVRYKKPVGIYWMQAAVVQTANALGLPDAAARIWLYRAPSLLGAVGSVVATYWCALAFLSRRGAGLAALMMAASTLLGVEARLAKTDAMLLFTVVVAMGALGRVYLSSRRSEIHRLGWGGIGSFWTALAVGFLIKGPIILMIVGLAAATLAIIDRSARWLSALRPIAGMGWFALIVLPWCIAIYQRVGGAVLLNSVAEDMVAKVASGQETHGAPPGLYLLLFFVTFFPASLLAGLAAPAVWATRREPAIRFLLAWLTPSWIIFELVATKLPHYVLPLYPPIAILIAGAIEAKSLWRRPWLTWGLVWWLFIPIIVIIVAMAGAIMIGHSPAVAAWPFFVAALMASLFAWRSFGDKGVELALLRAAAGAILMAIGLYAVIIPAMRPAFPSVALAAILGRAGCEHPVAASVGYEEPSLVFLAGTNTLLTDDAASAADFLALGACRFAFVETRQEPAFTVRAHATGLRLEPGPRIEGYNLSNGQAMTIAVYKSPAAP